MHSDAARGGEGVSHRVDPVHGEVGTVNLPLLEWEHHLPHHAQALIRHEQKQTVCPYIYN